MGRVLKLIPCIPVFRFQRRTSRIKSEGLNPSKSETKSLAMMTKFGVSLIPLKQSLVLGFVLIFFFNCSRIHRVLLLATFAALRLRSYGIEAVLTLRCWTPGDVDLCKWADLVNPIMLRLTRRLQFKLTPSIGSCIHWCGLS